MHIAYSSSQCKYTETALCTSFKTDQQAAKQYPSHTTNTKLGKKRRKYLNNYPL